MLWDIAVKTFNGIWPMLTIFLVVLASVRMAYIFSHKERICFYKEFLTLAFLIYILLLFQLLTSTEINQNSGINYVPFTEILRYEIGSPLFIYNVLGNILVFIPFGYFISYYIKAKKITPLFIVTLVTSTCIELVQLKIGRSLDVDDIILNVIGGLMGYLLYVGLTAIKNHLPKFLQRDSFYNILCILFIGAIMLYVLDILR